MSDLLIGLDIGTSAVKAGLFDLRGNALRVQRHSLQLHTPQQGWAEQDPDDWWPAAQSVLRALVSDVDTKRVQAVGLCGQCPSHVLIDRDGNALGRTIIWSDSRAQEEAEWLRATISEEQAERWTGSPFIADASLPPARLLWLKSHRQADWELASAIIQPKDYAGLRLTGEVATDVSSAFCLLEPVTKRYTPEFFEAIQVPTDLMPRALQLTDVLGEITPQAAESTGLAVGTPVVTGTIDAWCDTLAGGGSLPGGAVDVAGTSEILSLGTDRMVHAQGVFLGEFDNENRFLCGPMKAGGGTLSWLAQGFYPDMGDSPDFDRLEEDAASVESGCAGLVFLPYLDGERSPVWNPEARGAFVGLSLTHGRRHCVRAVYEGVAFAVRQVLEVCEKATSSRAERVVVCGGGSRSKFWNQVKADVLQRPIVPSRVAETACLGAAMLAGVGTGCYSSLTDAFLGMQSLGEQLEPRRSVAEEYAALYAAYCELYPALETARLKRPAGQSIGDSK